MSFVAESPIAPDDLVPTTLTALVERSAVAGPDRPALVGAGAPISYRALVERSRALAGGLRRLGIGRGDVVAAQLPNGPDFVTLYLAAARLGAALQTLHMPYRGAELEDLLRHSGAKLAAALPAFRTEEPAATLLALRCRLPALAHVAVPGAGGVLDGALSLAELALGPGVEGDEAQPDDLMLLLYTSGTTASPKAVPNPHRGFLTNARASAVEFGLAPDDVVLALAPFTHLYGAFALHIAFASGAASALLPAFDPAEFVRVVRATGATAIFAAPAHFAPLLAAGVIRSEDFASVRTICVSGSPVAPELAGAIEAAIPSARVTQLWGMSELQAGSYGRPRDPVALRHGTAGRPSPGTALRIVDDAGATRESGFDGRLQVRGPSLFAGYRGNPEASAAAFAPDGWFDTGDTGRLTEEGALVLTGRVKEIINRGGVKFSPVDVEIAIERMPEVARAAIVPMADPVLGERAVLFVVASGAAPVTLDAVKAHLDAAGIAKFKWPERLETIDAMPLTPTQKIMRGRLADLLRDRTPAADASGRSGVS